MRGISLKAHKLSAKASTIFDRPPTVIIMIPSRRRSAGMTVIPPPAPGRGILSSSTAACSGSDTTTGQPFATAAAARRSASQIAASASQSFQENHDTNEHESNGAQLCDASKSMSASGGARGRRSQLPANILRRMFGGGGRGDDKNDQHNDPRRGSDDTCPDDEDADGDEPQAQEATVTVRDLGYDCDEPDSSDTAAIPRRSSLRTPTTTSAARQRRRRSSVSFDQNVRFKTIPNLESLSLLQRSQLYYEEAEYVQQQENIKDDIRAIRRREANAGSIAGDFTRSCIIGSHTCSTSANREDDNGNDEEGPCNRGIEHYLVPKQVRLARTEAAANHVAEMLRFQNFLKHPSPLDYSSNTSDTPAQSFPTTTTTSIPHQLAARSLQLSGPARHLALEAGQADEDFIRRVWGWRHPRHPAPTSSSARGHPSSRSNAKGASASSLLPLPPVATDDSNEERARCA